MAKFNPGLLIVLLLAGFAVFAFAGTKKDNPESGWNLNDLIPSNATGSNALVFGLGILILGGIYGISSFISELFPDKPVPWEILTSSTGWPKYK